MTDLCVRAVLLCISRGEMYTPVCVCERERARERAREGEREGEREGAERERETFAQGLQKYSQRPHHLFLVAQ